jgi:hypothetical protein
MFFWQRLSRAPHFASHSSSTEKSPSRLVFQIEQAHISGFKPRKDLLGVSKVRLVGNKSDVKDNILRGLCTLASLSQLALVIFFFLAV